jgi:hypothetical protein
MEGGGHPPSAPGTEARAPDFDDRLWAHFHRFNVRCRVGVELPVGPWVAVQRPIGFWGADRYLSAIQQPIGPVG